MVFSKLISSISKWWNRKYPHSKTIRDMVISDFKKYPRSTWTEKCSISGANSWSAFYIHPNANYTLFYLNSYISSGVAYPYKYGDMLTRSDKKRLYKAFRSSDKTASVQNNRMNEFIKTRN